MTTQPPNYDNDLAKYFTDVEHLQNAFKNFIAAPTLTKHLLVIHGVGGIGKSSLLRIFRLHCKGTHVLVALVSGDETKSVLGVLSQWAVDLKADGAAFPSFGKTCEHYRAIQAKVDEQAKKTKDTRGRLADIAGKAASKSAEMASGALAGAAFGSIIPGIGTALGSVLGGVLGGMGVEALVDWMRGFLKQPDIDLLLDPTKKLTDDFLADITVLAGKHRIVLMLDTFERMTALDDWTSDVVQRLHRNVFFVIAGRALPNWWSAQDFWVKNAQVEELKPMTENVMRDLVNRYYATMRGGEPDPAQVEAIIRFAHGLPMVVASAVKLWVKYRIEDFQSVKTEVIANLVDQIIEGVPNELIPALEAAAAVRWFDQPILRAVTGLADVREVYNELRSFPFVRGRDEGWALHDAVREIIDDNLLVQDSERHCELHERAAEYFEKQLKKATGEDVERLGIERLYHRLRADEEAGIELFQEMAEGLSRYQLVNRLQVLLSELNSCQLNRSSSLHWRDYYHLHLEMLKGKRTSLAESYRMLAKNANEPKLLAYVLCDLGEILIDPETYRTTSEEGKRFLEQAISLIPRNDTRLIFVYSHLRMYYFYRGQWNDGIAIIQKQFQIHHEMNDEWGVTQALRDEAFGYGYLGDWRKAMDLHNQVHQRLMLPSGSKSLRADVRLRPWYLIWSGRYKDADIGLREAIEIEMQIGLSDPIWAAKRDLAFSLSLQDRFEYGNTTLQELLDHFEEYGRKGDSSTLLGFWGFSKAREGDFVQAKELLIRSWEIKQSLEDGLGYQETLYWLGYVSELASLHDRRGLSISEEYYLQALSYKRYNRQYFECAALTGLVRVKHAQGDYGAISTLLAEAEQLAQKYEYNDHLASLRLTQGMTMIGVPINEYESVLSFLKQAMVYALRYNRFLLDEVLSGRPQGTPLLSIIPCCLACGEDGQRMLTTLREWWQTGVNDIGTPRLVTISPIPEGIPLLEAERLARERESGDGSPQRRVAEQIDSALFNKGQG